MSHVCIHANTIFEFALTLNQFKMKTMCRKKESVKSWLYMLCLLLLFVGCSDESADTSIDNGNENENLSSIVQTIEDVRNTINPIFEECNSVEEFIARIENIGDLPGIEGMTVSGDAVFATTEDGFTFLWDFSNNMILHEDSEVKSNMLEDVVQTMNVLHSSENKSRSSKENKYKSLCIMNQMSEDDGFANISQQLEKLKSDFRASGFNAEIKNHQELTLDFFREDIYKYDMLLLMTHGSYQDDIFFKKHWFRTGQSYKRDWFANILANSISEGDFYLNYYLMNIGFGLFKEIRNGKTIMVDTYIISEDFFKYSEGRFDNDAIIFNVACYSLKDNENVADIFIKKGAATYLGYNDANCRGYFAGINFFKSLLEGQNVSEAYYSLPYGERFDNSSDSWHEERIKPGKKITKHNARLKLIGDETIRITSPNEPIRPYLEKLYKDANGDNWVNNTNWCTNAPVEEWYGVYCYSDSLYDISLNNNGVVGSINLDNCPYIKNLYVVGSNLTNLSLQNCCNLRSLDLWSFGDTTKINSINVSGCKNLSYLDCGYGNTLYDLEYVNAKFCNNLEYFDYTEGVLRELDLSYCANLESVCCCDNHLSLLLVAGCSELYSILCQYNNLTKLDLSDCKKLEMLNCSNNKIRSQIPDYFRNYDFYGLTFDWLYEYAYFEQTPEEDGWVHDSGGHYYRINDYGWYFPGEPHSRQHWWTEE